MKTIAARRILPNFLRAPLWGDRERWGLTIDLSDPVWREWQSAYTKFYIANQRGGIGVRVNDSGYRIMSAIDLTGKRVLEIGAGDIRHMPYWNGTPVEYILADISEEMMQMAVPRLENRGISVRALPLQREQALPLPDASVDVVVSFYSLEHLYPLRPYLEEMLRVLKPGGILVGAIPAEGGLAWGLGRMLTSRRWFRKNTSIDPDMIICWEHPNFADQIVVELDRLFERNLLRRWPLPFVPLLDANLIFSFVYRKADTP